MGNIDEDAAHNTDEASFGQLVELVNLEEEVVERKSQPAPQLSKEDAESSEGNLPTPNKPEERITRSESDLFVETADFSIMNAEVETAQKLSMFENLFSRKDILYQMNLITEVFNY